MTRPNTVDRDREIDLIASMAAGKTDKRILLIQANSGLGKTRLLEAFLKNHPPDVDLAVVDFKNGGFGVPELLHRICQDLGNRRFPQLLSCIMQLAGIPTTQIDHNTLLGRNNIHSVINMNTPDEATREIRMITLIDAFFEDIEKLGRVTLVFDTFNGCDPSLQRWLSSAFLRHICHTPKVVVVIAGQHVPEPSIEWRALHTYIALTPIQPEFWYQYCQQLGITVSLDALVHICRIFEGNSLRIAEYLDTQMLEERFG